MRKLLLISMVLFAIWAYGLYSFSQSVLSQKENTASQAEAIVVLTGGSGRIDYGFTLLKQARAKKLFISGVWHDVDKDNLLKKNELEEYKDQIEFDYKSTSTHQNAMNTAKWVREENIKSILLVTANYHIARSMVEFKTFVQDVEITPVPVFPKGFKTDSWWSDSVSKSLMISEYHKYWIVRLLNL